MWLWLLKIPTHFLMTMLTVILWYCCWCWWRSRCCWRQQLCQRHLMVSFVADRIEGTVKWVTSWAVSFLNCSFCLNKILHYFPFSVRLYFRPRDISHFSNIYRHKCPTMLQRTHQTLCIYILKLIHLGYAFQTRAPHTTQHYQKNSL